jgi:CHAD domain-containing protein
VKPERIDLGGVESPAELVGRVMQTRMREVRALATGLDRREKQGLHDFRIACKRLRYALERFQALEPSLDQIAEHLALLQDALGEAHDRDVLLAILPPTMVATQRRLQNEREACIDRAATIWTDLERMIQALDSHRI